MAACLFCGVVGDLTEEHIFPAALGGDDVIRESTCESCNGGFSEDFEASFNNAMKFFCWLFQIGNREGVIPNLAATATWQGAELKVIIRHDGRVRPLGRGAVEVVGNDGTRQFEYILPTARERKKFEERAKAKGKKVIPVTDPIELSPGTTIPMNFIADTAAKRTAAKVALMCLAKRCGLATARSDSFRKLRDYVRTGEGNPPTRLFVSRSFNDSMQSGPHQHSVFTYLNGQDCTAWAIVRFFGGLSYIVQLSDEYVAGVDYGYFYIYDAYRKQEDGMLLGHLEAERLAIADVLKGATTFDDVGLAAEVFLEYIKASINAKFGEGAIS